MAIDALGLVYTRKFIRTIESGGKRGDGSQALVFSQYQANVSHQTIRPLSLMINYILIQAIRGTVLQLRVFFKVLVDQSRLYQLISRECILPCLSEVRKLPMEEISELEQQAAQDRLRDKAVDAKKRIAEIAKAVSAQVVT